MILFSFLHYLSITLFICVLQKLMQLPTISGSIEVWDFLSVDSQVYNIFSLFYCIFMIFQGEDSYSFLYNSMQTYIFSNSFSIVETLSGDFCMYRILNFLIFLLPHLNSLEFFFFKYISTFVWNFIVDLEDKPSEKSKRVSNYGGPLTGHVSSKRDHLSVESREPPLQMQSNVLTDGFRLNAKGVSNSPVGKQYKKSFDKSGNDSEARAQTDASHRNLGTTVKGRRNNGLEASELVLDAANDPTLPTEVNS